MTQVDFGYGPKNGPHTWSLSCKEAAGSQQSPINIVRSLCEEDLKLGSIVVKSLKDGPQLLTRKKHNFQVSFPQDAEASLQGGPLKGIYILQQFHYHWGCEDKWGSEHYVDGHPYAGELHMVFLNEKYNSIAAALGDPEGLSVVGIFLECGENEHKGIKPLLNALKSSNPDCDKLLEKHVDIKELIPNVNQGFSKYYTYQGSLTTPPCSECVRWIVIAEPISLSHAQFKILRTMHSCEDCETVENFRPPLPVGKRKVVCSFKQKL